MIGNPARSTLVQGAFERWIREREASGIHVSASDWHELFARYRYGFMDGELNLNAGDHDDAYLAGIDAGRQQTPGGV